MEHINDILKRKVKDEWVCIVENDKNIGEYTQVSYEFAKAVGDFIRTMGLKMELDRQQE